MTFKTLLHALVLGASTGMVACGGDGELPRDAGTTRNTAVIAATDFQVVGLVATLDLETFEVAVTGAQLSSDPVLASSGGRIYAVNRFQFDNVQILDPEAGYATVAQHSTGNGSNPHDVVVIGDEAFVSRYEPPFDDVLVMDLATGEHRATIDLAGYADTATDPSMLPRPHRMMEVDGRIHVLLQHYDPTFSVAGRGSMVVIEPVSRTVVDHISLGGDNPEQLAAFGGDLWVALGGRYFPNDLTGGVARVGSGDGIARLVLDDDVAGGNVSSIAVVDERLAYVVVTEFDDTAFTSVGRVRQLDPTTGALGREVLTCDGFTPTLGFDGEDRIVVLCRDLLSPGAYVLEARSGEVLAGPIGTGLPPFSLAFLE